MLGLIFRNADNMICVQAVAEKANQLVETALEKHGLSKIAYPVARSVE